MLEEAWSSQVTWITHIWKHSIYPGLSEHLDWIRSQALTCLPGLLACGGGQGEGKLKDMFANVYLIHDCQHPCVGDSWGSEQGPGKVKLTHPRLAVDPSQCWHCPSSGQIMQLLSKHADNSSGVQCRMDRKAVLCYVIVPIKFIWRHLMLDICKSGEFSDRLLLFLSDMMRWEKWPFIVTRHSWSLQPRITLLRYLTSIKVWWSWKFKSEAFQERWRWLDVARSVMALGSGEDNLEDCQLSIRQRPLDYKI